MPAILGLLLAAMAILAGALRVQWRPNTGCAGKDCELVRARRPLPKVIRIAYLFLGNVLFTLTLMASPANAVIDESKGYAWLNTGFVRTQTVSEACRFWPQPPYTSSSTSYQLGNNLSTIHVTRNQWWARIQAKANDWSTVPSANFHFFQDPIHPYWNVGDPIATAIFQRGNLSTTALATNYFGVGWDSQNRPVVTVWHIEFNPEYPASAMGPGPGRSAPWVYDGAVEYGWDVASVALHELGHSLTMAHMNDRTPAWTDADRPTMYGNGLGVATYWMRTLAAGDRSGLALLY